MLNLLNNPTFDNERNVLNADLFVNNLKNTLKAFEFNPKVTYKVYRTITSYNITWNDDKDYNDIYELRKEIALSLGIRVEELKIIKKKENEIEITVLNMKIEDLSLKEVLSDFKKNDNFEVVLGLDEYDNIVTFDFDKDRNLLVTGVSGTGKTNLFNNIIMNILINYSSTKIIILDSQGINYNNYSDIIRVINKEKNIIEEIHSLRKEFEERVKSGNKDRVVVFIDEVYEILKMDMQVKNDINYLLELGSTMNIHLIISTDSVMEEDINDLFDRDNISKLSFYLTTRGEYNMFLNRVVTDSLNKEGVYLNTDKELSKISIPLINDEEIDRVVNYIKEQNSK